jgi:hypothetical protein
MKKITFAVLTAAFFCFGNCWIASGQDSGVARSDQITQGQQIIQADDSMTGKFEPVDVAPSATSDVALQFPTSLANRWVSNSRRRSLP